MKEEQKNNLLNLFIGSTEAILNEKRKNPKKLKKLNKFKARINIGLQIDEDAYVWFYIDSQNGEVQIQKGRLDTTYDLEIKSVPEDFMFYCNGEYSLTHMLSKKNKYGNRKLRFYKGTTGRNLGKLLKLPGLFVLD